MHSFFSLGYGRLPTRKAALMTGRDESKQNYFRSMRWMLMARFPRYRTPGLSSDMNVMEINTFRSITSINTRTSTLKKQKAPYQHRASTRQAPEIPEQARP